MCCCRFLPTPEDGGTKNEEDGPDGDSEEVRESEEVAPVEGDNEPGMWEEVFNSHYDSKPYGGCYFSYSSSLKLA